MTLSLKELQISMSSTIENLSKQLTGVDKYINISLVSQVKVVDSTGQKIPLDQIAVIGKKGNNISIIPFDLSLSKSIVETLKQAGFNAFVFSKVEVTISVPQPSAEEQFKIVALIKKLGEEAKIALRNIRQSFRNKHKMNDKEQQKLFDKEIDSVMNKNTILIDGIVKNKLKIFGA